MKYEHLWNINNSITNWHWWFSYLLLIFSSITKCKIIIKLDHSVAGCRLLECNMDVVIIYRGKFSVSRKIRMQVLCHTPTHCHLSQHRGELDIMVWEDISTGNKKTDNIHLLFILSLSFLKMVSATSNDYLFCHSWSWKHILPRVCWQLALKVALFGIYFNFYGRLLDNLK